MHTYNLFIQKRRALQRLKESVSIIVLPLDKGRLVVVMNKSDYEVKPNDLLSIKNTLSYLLTPLKRHTIK